MTTDFTYGGKQIVTSGPIKPGGKDMPGDARTRVDCYADIASIPNPYVGLKITVKVDETNNTKMIDYIVKSLKANSMGFADSVIDEVVRYVDYLGVNTSGGGTGLTDTQLSNIAKIPAIQSTVDALPNNYASKNHNHSGYASSSHRHDASEIDNLPSGGGTGLTSEQAQQLQTAYEHSQSPHVTTDDVSMAVRSYVNSNIGLLKGDKGDKGDTGATGADGAKGQDGITPTLRVGSVTTLEAGNNATVTMSESNNEYTLNFGIPKGAKGDTGASGSSGSSSTVDSEWSGKVASFLGDSITYGAKTTKIYHQYLKELVGFSTCNNYGIDGASITNHSNGICTRYNNVASDSDIIFIFGGTNDFYYNKPLGEWYTLSGTTRTLNKDVSTFRGALAEICDGLITKFPTKQIILMTPIHRDRLRNQQTDLEANASGLYLDDYVECVKEAGKIFGIPVIDLNGESGLYPMNTENANAYFHADDKLHPNANGHLKMARVIQGKLRTILPLDISYTPNVYGNIVLSKTSITMNEGTSNTFTVKLDKAPTNSQVVALSVNNTDVTLSTNTLTFTSGNYDQAQEVRVNVTEDSDKTNDNCIITLSSSGVANKTVTLTINDITVDEPEEPSGGTDLTGKSYKLTFNGNQKGFNHVVFSIAKDEDYVVGGTLKMKFDITNATNFSGTSTVNGIQIYTAARPEVNNTDFNGTCTDFTTHNTTFSNGSANIDFNYTLKATNAAYLKVTYGLKPNSSPASIDISNISVTINGKSKPILAVGAFFASERCEVTEL